jgi:hypothetical protein
VSNPSFHKFRLYFTGLVILAIWSLLAWNHTHGGVPSHHILAREDLPSFSNWWGGLLLPALSWFLLSRIQKRVPDWPIPSNIVFGFVGALVYGILLAMFFTLGKEDMTGWLFQGAFLLGLFFPIYRAEYLLGFVFGMTYTFGAVLPIGIGSMLALIGAVLYLLVRRGGLYLVSRVMKNRRA